MSRKTKEEAEKTRARILASALSLFVKKGYEKTTFTDIAARLKMTKGAVYWHFETKEDLLVALVEEIRDSEYYIPQLSFVAELDGEIVGHFLFSRFPLSKTPTGGHGGANETDIVMLAPVSVHADHLRQGIGSAMIRMGIEKVREMGFKGITVEGNFHFYNQVGFRTSSEFGIFPTSGWPMSEPRCMMCQETREGSLNGIRGYIVYDMYFNA